MRSGVDGRGGLARRTNPGRHFVIYLLPIQSVTKRPLSNRVTQSSVIYSEPAWYTRYDIFFKSPPRQATQLRLPKCFDANFIESYICVSLLLNYLKQSTFHIE